MSPYDQDPKPTIGNFNEFASSYDNWFMYDKETTRRADHNFNLLVLASDEYIQRDYFRQNPTTGKYDFSSGIRMKLGDQIYPQVINIAGEAYGLHKKDGWKIDDHLTCVLWNKYSRENENVAYLWLRLKGRGLAIHYNAEGSFEYLGFSDRTNPVSGPECVPLTKEDFSDPGDRRVKVRESNGLYVASRDSNDLIKVQRLGLDNQPLDEISFPLSIDRERIIKDLIHTDLLEDPYNAGALADKMWKRFDYKELFGVDWIRHNESNPPASSHT